MQELAPTSSRVGPVLQYLRDRPTPLGELYTEIKSETNFSNISWSLTTYCLQIACRFYRYDVEENAWWMILKSVLHYKPQAYLVAPCRLEVDFGQALAYLLSLRWTV